MFSTWKYHWNQIAKNKVFFRLYLSIFCHRYWGLKHPFLICLGSVWLCPLVRHRSCVSARSGSYATDHHLPASMAKTFRIFFSDFSPACLLLIWFLLVWSFCPNWSSIQLCHQWQQQLKSLLAKLVLDSSTKPNRSGQLFWYSIWIYCVFPHVFCKLFGKIALEFDYFSTNFQRMRKKKTNP